jgi:hypothetical protein
MHYDEEAFYQWLSPMTIDHCIPYWRLTTVDDLRRERDAHHLEGIYIVCIPDENEWMTRLSTILDNVGDEAFDIYPECVRIRDRSGIFVYVWNYRCRRQNIYETEI